MRRVIGAGVVCLLASIGSVGAQEHWNEGPVWTCEAYRTLPGQFDNYMNYLREYWADVTAEGREEGLFVDSKVFLKMPRDPQDWDVMFCTAYENGSAAMDYDDELDAKWNAIVAKHRGTEDEDQQTEMVAPRLEMRTFLGGQMMREIELKPMPAEAE